jgi:hypothetical protein
VYIFVLCNILLTLLLISYISLYVKYSGWDSAQFPGTRPIAPTRQITQQVHLTPTQGVLMRIVTMDTMEIGLRYNEHGGQYESTNRYGRLTDKIAGYTKISSDTKELADIFMKYVGHI